jgi:PAS domain S-box-containing protein
LIIQNQPLGALTIYAQEPEAFDEEEMKLLSELATDLSFGIRALHTLDEHARAEEARRKSEASLADAQRTAHLGSWDWDVVADRASWSDEMYHLFGLPVQSFAPTLATSLELFHPEDREKVKQALEKAFRTGEPYSADYRILRPDGSERVVHAQGKVNRDSTSRPVRMTGTLQDITDWKRAEEALRQSEQKFRLLAETIEDVFWMSAPGVAEMVYVSPAYEKLWGRSVESLYRTPLSMLERLHPDDKERFIAVVQQHHAKGRAYQFEYRIVQPDGSTHWILERGFPISDESGKVKLIAGLCTDITERKQLEEQFRQAQKMEAMGRLAGGIAHDFNNLLTIVTGYRQLMLEEPPEKSPLRQQVTEVLKATERATGLTRQLLAFGRWQVLAPLVLDLSDVVANMENMLRRLIGEDVELVTIPGPELGHVKADPGQIEQVILNLAVIARDAMPEGGRLTIETSNMLLDEHYASMHVSVQPGSYVMLAVSDTGCGMDAETQAHLFEPFFTTKEKGKGTGLGLATVYGIIKQSGGYIWVYSEVGKGTTFKIYLPRIHEPVEATELAPAESAPAGGSEAILLVEDDSSVRSLVGSVLESRGYRLLVAHNGEEALELCKQHQGPLHLLLTDVVMPGMSGRELAARLTPIYREMKVLYMSGYTDNAIVHHGVLDADVEFLQKPFSPQSLANKVRSVLDKEK